MRWIYISRLELPRCSLEFLCFLFWTIYLGFGREVWLIPFWYHFITILFMRKCVTDKFLWKLFIIFDFAPDLYTSFPYYSVQTHSLPSWPSQLFGPLLGSGPGCGVHGPHLDWEYGRHPKPQTNVKGTLTRFILSGSLFIPQLYPRILAKVNIYQEGGGEVNFINLFIFTWSLFCPAALPHNIRRVAIYPARFTALFCLVSRTLFTLGPLAFDMI